MTYPGLFWNIIKGPKEKEIFWKKVEIRFPERTLRFKKFPFQRTLELRPLPLNSMTPRQQGKFTQEREWDYPERKAKLIWFKVVQSSAVACGCFKQQQACDCTNVLGWCPHTVSRAGLDVTAARGGEQFCAC